MLGAGGAQDFDIRDAVLFGQHIGRAVEPDFDNAFEHRRIRHRALSFGRIDGRADARGDALQFLIRVLLVFQAAHQPAAGPRDFGGIHRKPLFFRHFDRDRLEIVQKGGAAERFAADAETAEHFCLVAYADLAQFDAGAERRGEVLDKFAEIDPAVGGEKEDDLAAVEIVVDLDQLHLEFVVQDFLFADFEGVVLSFAVGRVLFGVGFGGDAHNLLGGFDAAARFEIERIGGGLAVFGAVRGLDDHFIAVFNR